MIEVRIRVLMKGDMGDVVPSVTLTDIKRPEALDVAKIAADWLARRRVLWAGFVRQVEKYRAARVAIDAPVARAA